MLEALWAVLIDLYHFIIPTFLKRQSQMPLLTPTAPPFVPSSVPTSGEVLSTGTTAWVKIPYAICYRRPILAFDSRVGVVSYGTTVSVTLTEGQFVHITTGHLSGWVSIEALTFEANALVPILQSGEVYSADDTETTLLRARLQDECDGGSLHLALQSTEFILYTLLLRGVKVLWPAERPRRAGAWQTILKGQPQVRIGIEPKTGSVMEYYTEHHVGVLAFVESVHPDNTIVIQSVGMRKDGEYRVDTLQEREWRELRPVFISFI